MKAIVSLKTKAPLNLRSSRSTSNSETLDYIPGTSLLGGLAAAHIKLRDGEKDEFSDFFLNDKIRFENLYPTNFGTKDTKNPLDDANEFPVKPLPATARTCKRFGGFRFYAKPEEPRHGVTDHLIIWGLFAIWQDTILPHKIELLDQNRNCTYELEDGLCNESLDRFGGFYRQGENRNELAKSKVDKRMLTRTGISRETGTVKSGILYNREVINEGQKFWGTFYFESEDLFEKFYHFVQHVAGKKMLRLGNNRTRGLGLVKLNLVNERLVGQDAILPAEVQSEYFVERVRSFDRKFQEKAEDSIKLPHKFYFPITLQSDMIIRDRFLRYRIRIDGDYLREIYSLRNAELVYHSAGIRRVVGWNALWGLPKDHKQAITMGSVFLFGYNGKIDDAFFKRLFELENYGIGCHRSEGFGEVTIADRFHWEVDEYAE